LPVGLGELAGRGLDYRGIKTSFKDFVVKIKRQRPGKAGSARFMVFLPS
jgi:hypothetical protein